MSRDGDLPLTGRVALVTGGSRGIGAAITTHLAGLGATVAINFVDRVGPARELRDRLLAMGHTVSLHRADLSQPDECEALVEAVGETHGGLTIVVHNAAAAVYRPLPETTLAQWQFAQDTNCRSTWLLAKFALPYLRNRPGARFLSVTNASTTKIMPGAGAFAAAKSGLETLTEYLSNELAPPGIVANCVRPGLVRTRVFEVKPELERAAAHERAVTPWPGGRTTTPEDVAGVIGLLCRDEAGWIVGQTITVDGGYHLWGSLVADSEAGSPS
jgi:NAD(P)-dependent dehydrogenase (short-subunit alcohol dehydrogenase family)